MEVAKNIVLAGVKQLTLHDPAPACTLDLASQFYLKEEHVAAGISRLEVGVQNLHWKAIAEEVSHTSTICVQASMNQLSELNAYVCIDSTDRDLSDDLDWLVAQNYSLVILLDTHFSEEIRINKFCRENRIR